ncbi:MAG: hypothetical protein O9312_04740 [Hylemonella sp.]|nr:hypothetical protein [Hylemonella sp.]
MQYLSRQTSNNPHNNRSFDYANKRRVCTAIALILFVAINMVSPPSDAAEVTRTLVFKDKPAIRVTGKISRGDFDKIRRAAKSVLAESSQVIVSLNSEGGDYEEALRIAELIRNLNAQTLISGHLSRGSQTTQERCYSACFLIHAAGSVRHYTYNNIQFDNSGDRILSETPVLGIHRPYLNPELNRTLSASESRERYERIEASSRKLLSSVAIPQDVVDEMFKTSSTEIHLISESKFSERIGEVQPYYQEWIRSKCGVLDKSEIRDLGRIIALRLSPENSTALPPDLSEGYAQYLQKKQSDIEVCSDRAVLAHQRSVLGLPK